MTTPTLTRLMPAGEWTVLADLARAGHPVNCGTLTALHDDVDMAGIRAMADEYGLVSVHEAGSGSDKRPRRWLTAPNLTEARLTAAGERVAAQVVHLAGVLLWLSRRTAATTVALLTTATELDTDQLGTLLAHQLVEAVTADGDPDARPAPTHVRITSRGRLYTTER